MSLLRHQTLPLIVIILQEKVKRESSFICEMGAIFTGISFQQEVNLSFDTEVNTLWQASFSLISQELL